MLKVAFVIYRKWGFEIFRSIEKYQSERKDFEISALITVKDSVFRVPKKYSSHIKVYKIDPRDQDKLLAILSKHKIRIVFMYSWSFIIEEKILKKFICLCLHPSLLPEYRGGSPIQNQLINGVTESGVTIFRMNEKIDAGDICQQTPMSLLGDINDIFARMVNLGVIMTKKIITDKINDELVFRPQKKTKFLKVWRRRRPEESELFLEKIRNMQFAKVNNYVRGLLDPYPNAFIKLNRNIIYITEIIKYKALPKKGLVLVKSMKMNGGMRKLFLQVKDGYALILKYKIKKYL